MKALDSHRQGLYNSEMVKEKRDDESRRGGGGHYMEALKVAIADDNELMLDMLAINHHRPHQYGKFHYHLQTEFAFRSTFRVLPALA